MAQAAASTSQAPPPPPPVASSRKRKRKGRSKDELPPKPPTTPEEIAGSEYLERLLPGEESDSTYFKGKRGRKTMLSGVCCKTFRLGGGCRDCVTN